MHPLFPQPLPDETIYSLLCRFHLLTAQGSFRGNTLPLLGINGSRPSNEFPSFLPQFAKISGIDATELAKSMTSIHYYQPFISKEFYCFFLKALLTGYTASLQGKLGSIANRLTPGKTVKFCPLCAAADVEKYAIAYWHQVHQLIGVTACPIHHCKLVERSRTSSGVILPEPNETVINSPIDECNISNVISDEFIDNSFSGSRSTVYQAYFYQLKDLNLLSSTGRIRQKLLTSLLNLKIDSLSNCSVGYQWLRKQSDKGCYPECLFYRKHCNHQPIKHYLFIYALFGSWAKFCDCIYSMNSVTSSCEPRQIGTTVAKVDWTNAIKQLQCGQSLRAVASLYNTTVSTLKIKAQQLGVSVDLRPSKIYEDVESRILFHLRTGRCTKDIASKFGLSVGAIEKVLTKHPKLVQLRKRLRYITTFKQHKSKLIGYLKNHPNATRNELKNTLNGSYMWLYKHERDWLYSNIPKRMKAIYWPRKRTK